MIATMAIGLLNASAAEKFDANAKHRRPAVTRSVKQLQEDFWKLTFGMFICFNMATYTGQDWVSPSYSPNG
jgi:hypothetical protein